MSRNGSGVYSLPPGSVIANGQTSDATDLNTPLADIASDLNVARPVVAGGTGAANASDARDNLGVTTALAGKQDADDTLTSIAALGTAADKLAYTTSVDTWAEADLTAAGRALLDDADAEAQRTTLGLGTAALMANSADTDLTNDPDAAARRDIVKAYVDAGPKIKAWVNYSTLTTTSVRDSFNISSVTDVSPGVTQVNFSNAISANAAIVAVSNQIGTLVREQTTTSVLVEIRNNDANLRDAEWISLVVIG